MENSPAINNWDKYWNSNNINRKIMEVWAACFVGAYEKQFHFKPDDAVLDFGAGYGNVSYLIRKKVRKIYLYDKAEYIQEVLRHTLDKHENTQIIADLNEIREKVSVIILNSVCQYIDKQEFKNILDSFAGLSDQNTNLVIADIIPKNYSKMTDFLGQLSLGLKYGFFTNLLTYAISNTLFSPALSLSEEHLIKYDQDEMINLLAEHGFEAILAPVNYTYSRKRYTVYARLASSGQ